MIRSIFSKVHANGGCDWQRSQELEWSETSRLDHSLPTSVCSDFCLDVSYGITDLYRQMPSVSRVERRWRGGNSVGCQHSADTLVTYEALVNTLACTRNVKRITFRAITRAATTQPSSTAGLAYIRVHYSRDNLYVCSLLEMRLQEARTKTRSIE